MTDHRDIGGLAGRPPPRGSAPGEEAGLPAGWYHDPAGSGLMRYWDGSQWTRMTGEPDRPGGPHHRRRSPLSRAVFLVVVLAILAGAAGGIYWLVEVRDRDVRELRALVVRADDLPDGWTQVDSEFLGSQDGAAGPIEVESLAEIASVADEDGCEDAAEAVRRIEAEVDVAGIEVGASGPSTAAEATFTVQQDTRADYLVSFAARTGHATDARALLRVFTDSAVIRCLFEETAPIDGPGLSARFESGATRDLALGHEGRSTAASLAVAGPGGTFSFRLEMLAARIGDTLVVLFGFGNGDLANDAFLEELAREVVSRS